MFSAGKQDFIAALHFFEDAESWNPELDGIDRNLGMAAFQTGRYEQAAKSLGQYVSVHSDDQAASAALADARKRLHP